MKIDENDVCVLHSNSGPGLKDLKKKKKGESCSLFRAFTPLEHLVK